MSADKCFSRPIGQQFLAQGRILVRPAAGPFTFIYTLPDKVWHKSDNLSENQREWTGSWTNKNPSLRDDIRSGLKIMSADKCFSRPIGQQFLAQGRILVRPAAVWGPRYQYQYLRRNLQLATVILLLPLHPFIHFQTCLHE
jgi:hypothetical protein